MALASSHFELERNELMSSLAIIFKCDLVQRDFEKYTQHRQHLHSQHTFLTSTRQ